MDRIWSLDGRIQAVAHDLGIARTMILSLNEPDS